MRQIPLLWSIYKYLITSVQKWKLEAIIWKIKTKPANKSEAQDGFMLDMWNVLSSMLLIIILNNDLKMPF